MIFCRILFLQKWSNISTYFVYIFIPRFSIIENFLNKKVLSLGPSFLVAGDYNAKHSFCKSRLITLRGRVLHNTISKIFLNVLLGEDSMHWPTDSNKIPDIVDFRNKEFTNGTNLHWNYLWIIQPLLLT